MLLRIADDLVCAEYLYILMARHNLAQQIWNQGRHRESEVEFRAIVEIRRRLDLFGDPQCRRLEGDTLLASARRIVQDNVMS